MPIMVFLLIIVFGVYNNKRKLIYISAGLFYVFSTPLFSNYLFKVIEGEYHRKSIEQISNADAIVVLSGMLKTIKVNDKLKYEFDDGVDRILSGIDLFKNNKASLLILTKGQLPWSLGMPEGEYLKEFAVKFGVPKESILLTDNVQNTDQEAKSVKKLLNSNDAKVILITSAFHMPRAKKVFEASNIKVIPFAVDFINSHQKLTFMSFIPSAGALNDTSLFVREMIGRLYYNLKY